MDIHDYLIDQSGLDWNALLEEWHWLLPPEFTVWLLTRAGDLFIVVHDGSIHMLDVGAGTLSKVATSRDEACTRIDEPDVAKDWLMIREHFGGWGSVHRQIADLPDGSNVVNKPSD